MLAMKLIIDTSYDDLYLAIVDENYSLINKVHEKNLVKKSDVLITKISNLLTEGHFCIESIKEIYVTKGPGSFMGSRTGLLFAKTISLIKKTKLFVASSFTLLFDENTSPAFLDAKGGFKYKREIFENTEKLELVKADQISNFSYVSFEKNIKETLSKFKEEKDVCSVKTVYLKDPQIGDK